MPSARRLPQRSYAESMRALAGELNLIYVRLTKKYQFIKNSL